ncbi:MAG: DUF5597 domain-containing protein [Prevotella sp.]|nr:DUF5597 domain-containing protein [Prevotella sp.]
MRRAKLLTLLTLLLCTATARAQHSNLTSQTSNLKSQPSAVILGGELSNSAATSVDDIDEVMPRMKALGLNTVLVPAYWEFLEPEEGQFDYTLIDRTISKARENDLKVIFLWFGAWKNSMSCYAPLWFKQDTRRFPRACTATGKPLEIASAFSDEVFKADNRAFEALMRRIAERGKDVVVMVQVENEIGMLEDARDHSPLAEKAYKRGVPAELLTYLTEHEAQLHPWLKQRLTLPKPQPRGQRRTGPKPTWESLAAWNKIFGNDIFTDEIFMAYYYAVYVEKLCKTAHSIDADMPLYVNAAMNSRGRQPGQYPSAGPLAHLIDLWQAGAPSLLLLAPDIYDTGFKGWAAQYALPSVEAPQTHNRLFIPESRCCENSGVRALYAFGEHQALGFSPFAIDQASPRETESVTKAYELIGSLNPVLTRRGVASWGLLFDQQDKERIIEDDGLAITCRHYFTLPWDARATDGSTWPEGGAMLIKLARNEYLLAGSGVVVEFKTKSEKQQEQQVTLGEDGFVQGQPTPTPPQGRGLDGSSNQATPQGRVWSGLRCGIGSVDEVQIQQDGTFKYLRRHNGDQDHQGRHARIAVGEWKALHIKLYQY